MPDASMSADLVASTTQAGAEDMASLEALDPQARELAVTRWLSEARVSLAHALETSDPAQVANFKAQIATVAEATKQLGLSKEIQLDAQEMVRRAERGVGLAIRKGQAEGTIYSVGNNPYAGNQHGEDPHPNSSSGQPVTAFASKHDLSGHNPENPGIYAMTDGVSDEEFEEALTDAKTEDNMSRANVIRKIKRNEGGPLSRRQRADLIADLAVQGYASRQMPKRVGVTEETVRDIARDFNIDIPADKIIAGTRRLDHTRMVESTTATLADLVSATDLIDFNEVNPRDAARWATSLNDSLRALNRFHKQIKEMAPND